VIPEHLILAGLSLAMFASWYLTVRATDTMA
jgi:hypothetical protein